MFRCFASFLIFVTVSFFVVFFFSEGYLHNVALPVLFFSMTEGANLWCALTRGLNCSTMGAAWPPWGGEGILAGVAWEGESCASGKLGACSLQWRGYPLRENVDYRGKPHTKAIIPKICCRDTTKIFHAPTEKNLKFEVYVFFPIANSDVYWGIDRWETRF